MRRSIPLFLTILAMFALSSLPAWLAFYERRPSYNPRSDIDHLRLIDAKIKQYSASLNPNAEPSALSPKDILDRGIITNAEFTYLQKHHIVAVSLPEEKHAAFRFEGFLKTGDTTRVIQYSRSGGMTYTTPATVSSSSAGISLGCLLIIVTILACFTDKWPRMKTTKVSAS